MKTVKWLLAGAGDIATRRVAPALRDCRNSEITAICDVVSEQADILAEKMRVKTVYYDYNQALAETEADSVYIATPVTFHIDMCIKALNAEKHLLCEKPLGLNGAECLKLLKLVRKSSRVTSCSNYRLLSEQFMATKKIIENKGIGDLQGGWMIYATPHYDPGKSHSTRATGGSPIKGLGFYIINIAQTLLGMPSSVFAQTSTFDNERNLDDLSTILLHFPRGQQFSILIHYIPSGTGTRHELEFFGSSGRIYWPKWPPHGNDSIIKFTKEGREKINTFTNQNFHLPMIEDFVDAVLNNREPVCTIESAVKTELITDAIFRSAASRKMESVLWEEG